MRAHFHRMENSRRPLKKARNGGLQQRIQAAAQKEGKKVRRRQGTSWQLSWCRSGLMAFVHLRRCKLLSQEHEGFVIFDFCDSVKPLILEKLAGQQPNNCHRDLLEIAAPLSRFPQPMQCSFPFQDGKMRLRKVFLPHQWVATWYHQYPHSWRHTVRILKSSGTEWLAGVQPLERRFQRGNTALLAWGRCTHHRSREDPCQDVHWIQLGIYVTIFGLRDAILFAIEGDLEYLFAEYLFATFIRACQQVQWGNLARLQACG